MGTCAFLESFCRMYHDSGSAVSGEICQAHHVASFGSSRTCRCGSLAIGELRPLAHGWIPASDLWHYVAASCASYKAGKRTVEWIQDCYAEAPQRSTPLVGDDFNTPFGLTPAGLPWERGAGPYHVGFPTQAGDIITNWAQRQDLCKPGSFTPHAGPTFYGPHGDSSTIDHWLIPAGLGGAVFLCGIAQSVVRDHVPVALSFRYVLDPDPGSLNEISLQSDGDSIAACLQRGTGRRDFLERLKHELARLAHVIGCHADDDWPDEHWRFIIEAFQKAGRRCFNRGRKSYATADYYSLMSLRTLLLKALAR